MRLAAKDIVFQFLEDKSLNRFNTLINVLNMYSICYELEISENQDIKNVLVSFKNNSISNSYITIGAHYDVFPGSLGINDNTCALGAIIKFIIAVKANRQPLKENIEIVLFDKEESGMLGSKFYLQNRNKNEIKYALIFDIIGYGDALYYSKNNTGAEYLLSANNIKKLNQVLPSDNVIFCNHHINNHLIVALPNRDIIQEGNINKLRNNFIFHESFHNGKLDNKIEIINFNVVEQVTDLLLELYVL